MTSLSASAIATAQPADGQWPREQRAHLVVAAMRRRFFQAQYAPDRAAALAAIEALLPAGARLFHSESTTLEQLGLRQRLRALGLHALTYVPEDGAGADEAERFRLEREAFFADWFLGSPTAVTLDGRIVAGGPHGKNAAPLIFGPAQVLLVVGVNKIVKDKHAAFERVAAIHGTDRASYNSSGMLESALPRFSQRINVIVVGEDLGR